ncbi:MAG: TldD/PmbA family protein [Acidobacteria bacterium]|nr:MAG: TldD/PmbA family protein [Acidobacteriota bacterium]
MERIRNWISTTIGGGYEYELYLERRKRLILESAEEKIETLLKSEESGLGVRVFKKDRMGFSYTTELTEDSVRDCVRQSMQICDLTPEDEGLRLGACTNYGSLQTEYDREGLETSIEDKIELLIGLERQAKALDSRIRGVRKVSLKELEAEVVCFNSCGLEYTYRGTWYTALMAAVAEHMGDSSIAYEWVGSRALRNLPLQSMIEDVVFKATATLKPEPYETRVMPVILYRDASAMLLEAFSPIFLGDNLVKGKTFLKGREGERVFSELLNITDDGRMQGGFLSLPVDAEGYKTRENRVVENGIFRGFLHSTYSAIKSNAEPTGNSVRESYRNIPSSGITNLYIHRGEWGLEELINMEEEVFLITDLMGLHTVEPISGDFSLGAGGIIYRGGSKDRSVRGVIIGGNVKDLWNSILAIGKDMKFYTGVGSPSILVRDVTVGG